MKRSTFLKSLLAIPVAVKALGKVNAKPTPIDARILKNHDPDKYLAKWSDHIIIEGLVIPITEAKFIYDGCYEIKLLYETLSSVYQSWLNKVALQANFSGMEMECYITSMEVSADYECNPIELWLTVQAIGQITVTQLPRYNVGYLVPPEWADELERIMRTYKG